MAISTVIVCCLLIAVASANSINVRSANGVKVVQLNKEQKKAAAQSLATILNTAAHKLEEDDSAGARRSAEGQLDVSVDAGGADLSADDVVAYLQDAANQISGGAEVNRRQLSVGGNIGYSGGAWSGGVSVSYTFG